MIVPIRNEHSWWSPAMRNCVYHIMELQSKKPDEPDTLPEMKELWKQEFGIEMLMDPTGTGYDSMRFRDEKHYTFWLLKWG
jgi:hypothetical protein